jgi:ribonuclease HI
MAHVKVVCDASFDSSLRLTGYAGGVYVEDDLNRVATYMYQGTVAELRDSSEGELVAILEGLKELDKQSKASQFTVDSICIFSDSRAALNGLSNYSPTSNTTTNYTRFHREIYSISRKNDWRFSLSHVSGHVPDKRATKIEKLNAIADVKASEARRQAENWITTPPIHFSKEVAVLIPATPRNLQEAEEWGRLAHFFLQNNLKPRVYIEGPRNIVNHPFTDVFTGYANKSNMPPDTLYSIIPYDQNASRLGIDVTLMRIHILKSGGSPDFELDHKPVQVRAATASRIIFGSPSDSTSSMDNFSGRKGLPSKVVFDLLAALPSSSLKRPHTVQGWVATYIEHLSIPYISGLQQSFKYMGIKAKYDIIPRTQKYLPRESLPNATITDDKLKSELREIFVEYYGEIEINQLSHKMIDVLQKNGYPKTVMFESSMERFIMITAKNKADQFLTRVIKHASRITPPVNHSDPSLKEAIKPSEHNIPDFRKPPGK